MESSEVRIGNIVATGAAGTTEISTIDFSDGYVDSWDPIPLTEEWLTNFGFNSKYKSVHIHWNKGTFGIDQKSDVDDDHNSIPQEQVFYFDHMWEIKYVHQLQNLYFSLTGEELELKS